MLAIIPARGGSKRIPFKNGKMMGKIPLFEWSVNTARKSGLFDEIIVSTDDPAIAGHAERIGAEVHWREEVSDEQTLKEVWDMFEKPFCCLLPNPFIRPDDLIASSKIDGDVWSAIRIKENPPIFQDAGQFYWIRGKKQILYVLDKALDINTPEDWEKAEEML